jgi:hypothetical protein
MPAGAASGQTIESPYGMKTDDCQTRCQRVWFGAQARVTIGPGFLHRTGIGRFLIPHPPLANCILRLGLPEAVRRSLTFAHEFAHYRTMPVLFVYMLILAALFHSTGNTGVGEFILVFIGGLSAWEMMSEGLVKLDDAVAYSRAYEKVKSVPRIFFWTAGWLGAGVMPVLAILFRLQ